jgi:hypothetical protein
MTFYEYQDYVEMYEGRAATWRDFMEYNMRYGTIPLKLTLTTIPFMQKFALWWERQVRFVLSKDVDYENGVYSQYYEGRIYSGNKCLRVANVHQWKTARQLARGGMDLSEVKSFLEL